MEKLAQIRLDDSLFLLQASRPSSAYYLCGYAVELALKACIARLMQPNSIPDKAFINSIYTQRLESLLATAGLVSQFELDTNSDPQLAAFWTIAAAWTEESRYQVWEARAAATMIQAVYETNHGVFQWVKRHW